MSGKKELVDIKSLGQNDVIRFKLKYRLYIDKDYVYKISECEWTETR